MSLTFPFPESLDGAVITAALVEAGFDDVVVGIDGDGDLLVAVAGLADPLPPAEERNACATQEELDELVADWQAEHEHDDDVSRGKIEAVLERLLRNPPPPPPPAEPTIDERIAAALDGADTFDDFRAKFLTPPE